MKHTQGEWHLATSHNDYSDTWYIESKTQNKMVEIAAAWYTGKDEESAYSEAEANAKLIAAAPDLLEACIKAQEEILACYKMLKCDNVDPENATGMLIAAIKKATE